MFRRQCTGLFGGGTPEDSDYADITLVETGDEMNGHTWKPVAHIMDWVAPAWQRQRAHSEHLAPHRAPLSLRLRVAANRLNACHPSRAFTALFGIQARRLATAAGDLLVLALLTVATFLLVAVDVQFLGHEITELSATEITQEALLLAGVIALGLAARRRRSARGFLALGAGMAAWMLIRELDAMFDVLVYHGFWVWPASAVIVATMLIVFRRRDTLLPAINAFVGTKPYYYVLFGMAIVVVFSRCFGSGRQV